MSETSAAMAAPKSAGASRWLVILGIVLAAGVLSAFYGINEYAGGTGAIVKSANNNSARFEAIFTLNQDVLLEHHYVPQVPLIDPRRCSIVCRG